MALKIVKKAEIKKKTEKKPPTKRSLIKEKIKFLESLPSLTREQENELKELKDLLTKIKRGSNSKKKGASYERSIAEKFKKVYNVELSRTPQSGGFAKKTSKAKDFKGDIIPLDDTIDFKLHIECKNQKTWKLTEWLEQAKKDCPKGRIPIVIFHKYSTRQDFVTLTLKDFFSLVDKEKIFIKKEE